MYEVYKEAIHKHRTRQCAWIQFIIITQFMSKTNIEFVKAQEIKKKEIIHTMSKFRIPSSFIYHLHSISLSKEYRFLRLVLISESAFGLTYKKFQNKKAKSVVFKMMNRIKSVYTLNEAVTTFYKNCKQVT